MEEDAEPPWTPERRVAIIAELRRQIDRNRPEGYIVCQGSYHQRHRGPVTRTLTTHDPDEAAAETERLLAGWAWNGEES